MRLIDSDKLRVEVVHSGNIICLPHFSLKQIDTAPEVKAIPIEFIKEEMESARYVWSNSDKNVELYWKGVYKGLMALIRNWEKENGSNR